MVKPNSMSATAVRTFELCPARWAAEHFLRARSPSSDAADLGTALHAALEEFVKGGFHVSDQYFETLESFFYQSYYDKFSDDARYDEGLEMLKKWHKNNVPIKHDILSTEVKESFEVPSPSGPITFNYIIDRLDDLGDREYQAVDYKSSQMPMSPDALKKDIQARCYALAVQIKFPDAKRVWSTFDMLRHEPVGVAFTREENAATWKFLKNVARKIHEYDIDRPIETLNPQCHWCVRKANCKTLERANGVGAGTAMTPEEAADRRAALEYARKGLSQAIEELDKVVLEHCEQEEVLEFETELHQIKVTSSRRRHIDNERAKAPLPPEVVKEYGTLNLTAVDKILKDDRIDDRAKDELRDLMTTKYSEPKVKTEPLSPIEE